MMDLQPFAVDCSTLATAVGWLHPQVPDKAKEAIRNAGEHLMAARDEILRAQASI